MNNDLFQSVKYLEWLYLYTFKEIGDNLTLARLDWVTEGTLWVTMWTLYVTSWRGISR